MQIYEATSDSNVSTHAPRVGSDGITGYEVTYAVMFQPTLPVWGATPDTIVDKATWKVSTHAPRVGSDHDERRRSFSV